MPTAMLMDLPGVTLEQYLRVHRAITSQGQIDGLLLHSAAEVPGGIRVYDVWESPEAFDRFARERMMPAAADAGLDVQPQPQSHELANLWVPGSEVVMRLGADPMPE
jgi:hypothetical protein